MDKKLLIKQILSIFGVVTFFVVTNVFIYFVFTNRCVNDFSSQMQAKSVEVDEYLPFASETKIVKKEEVEENEKANYHHFYSCFKMSDTFFTRK